MCSMEHIFLIHALKERGSLRFLSAPIRRTWYKQGTWFCGVLSSASAADLRRRSEKGQWDDVHRFYTSYDWLDKTRILKRSARVWNLMKFESGWWFQTFFSPLPGKMIPFDKYFSNGLKPPSRNELFILNCGAFRFGQNCLWDVLFFPSGRFQSLRLKARLDWETLLGFFVGDFSGILFDERQWLIGLVKLQRRQTTSPQKVAKDAKEGRSPCFTKSR